MEILALHLFGAVLYWFTSIASATTFEHIIQGTQDITTVTIPVGTTYANMANNNF